MREQGRGAIVNTASLAGIRPFEWGLHYTSAKAGVVMLSMAVAKLVADAGVRVNAICPTGVDTDLAAHGGGADVVREKFGTASEDMRRSMLRPETVARAVLYLAAEADFSGRALLIDQDADSKEPAYYTTREWSWEPLELP
jgi:NAD(P)-dependent dehydrogenase (short-subunit alcohol dehydrogenase family)